MGNKNVEIIQLNNRIRICPYSVKLKKEKIKNSLSTARYKIFIQTMLYNVSSILSYLFLC